jgi:hypothetical protein
MVVLVATQVNTMIINLLDPHVLGEALDNCAYIEDVRALTHFVFHDRANGCSNVCILCQHGCGLQGVTALDDDGHSSGCDYLLAVRRTQQNETLADYVRRY